MLSEVSELASAQGWIVVRRDDGCDRSMLAGNITLSEERTIVEPVTWEIIRECLHLSEQYIRKLGGAAQAD